ncbi:hypothetical protein GCM10010387_03070 [Streptomyces inusitatus]|uniref:DUF1152 domain-containing protein n=1 Tax=Streptomyces inusitatus TaxID=68221 RepID=A0A918UJG6_9ACTN|nr:hypothetical protein GCM10010387_03070 [Streptomyces inusitatus]
MIVAAGGGGDAVAAVMVDGALYGDEGPGVVLTYAWDRLVVDPVAGPRGAGGFRGLGVVTPHVYEVGAGSEVVGAGGSVLPRLAGEVGQMLVLMDPGQGVLGMTRQLEELVERLGPESVDLLDVGGDVLARGDEPGLRSPLGDALALAACRRVNAEVRLLVAGPGLDGELSAGELRGVLGRNVVTLTEEDVGRVGGVLEWHPSEATGMLAATARGIRGLCEIRDAGLAVPLTDEGPTVHEVDLEEAFARNQLARAVAETATLAEAEERSREVCGFSEIDYERAKAARLGAEPLVGFDPEDVLRRVARFERRARERRISYTTFRHLAEVVGVRGGRREEFRALLLERHPEQYAAPLWRIPL